MAGKQLVSADEATIADRQHAEPCTDCPWSRSSLPGWLGNMTAQEWVTAAHGESTIECHTLLGAQCAGSAIYRANVCKLPRDPGTLRLPANRLEVFSSRAEFVAHHEEDR